MKRITTTLLALLLALSLSVTGWAEDPVIRDTPEIREETEILEQTESCEKPAIQETPENRDVSGTQESPKQETGSAVQETSKPQESPKSKEEKKQTSTKKEQKTPEITEAPTEEPILEKKTCEAFVTFFREDAGLNNAVIAGILANIQRESGFDPTRIGDQGNAFGLCQWNEKRQTRLDALCERANLSREDAATQKVFIIAELQVYYPDTWMLLSWLADTEDDAAWAAWYICMNFEAPVHMDEELVIRQQLAKDYFALLSE